MAGPLQNRSSQQPAEQELQRLHFLVSGLCSRFRLGTLAFVQVWTPAIKPRGTRSGPSMQKPLAFEGFPGLDGELGVLC